MVGSSTVTLDAHPAANSEIRAMPDLSVVREIKWSKSRQGLEATAISEHLRTA